MDQSLEKCIQQASERAIPLRHYFHRHPELSWQEVKTTDRLMAELKDLGVTVLRRGFGGTQSGILAEIKGTQPGPCLGVRGDIDALPVHEDPDHELKSEVDGVMHACGHDAHAAILIGVAQVLQSHRDQIHGSVRLIFQPAEESGTHSGALQMVEDGVLEGIDAVVGSHVWAVSDDNTIGYRYGAAMASVDIWNMTVRGKGGHGGNPHMAINPTICAAAMIPAIQSIVSQETNPLEPIVVTIGSLKAGEAPNVIPETCYVNGNVRNSSKAMRDTMPERFKRIVAGIAAAYRCTVDLNYLPIYPVTSNDKGMMDYVTETIRAIGLGDQLVELPMQMGSEDFSYFAEKVPGAYIHLGMGTNFPHHSPHFFVKDSVVPRGIRVMSEIALRYGKTHCVTQA